MFIADSCVGGLSVLQSLWNERTASQAVFLADYEINPLGVKSDSAIADVVAHWLERAARISDTLVIACNTLSIRYEQLRQGGTSSNSALKIVSMVDCFRAMLKHEAGRFVNKRVLVVGTAFTAEQTLYAEAVDRVIPGASVDTIAATELERKIARFEGWDGAGDATLTAELKAAIDNADVVVLACTCFPMVQPDLEVMYPDVVFLDPGAYCSGLLASEGNEQHKNLSIEVTGDDVPAALVISFAKSFLDEESIDLYRSQ